MSSFKAFMKQREDASNAFVNGEIGPLLDISTQTSPATIFPPNGLCVQSAEEVNAFNTSGARMFDGFSENRFEVMHMAESDGLAYWTGIQRSVVRMKGKPEPVAMDLRITEIFRLEDGEWKLIHRHADPLKG